MLSKSPSWGCYHCKWPFMAFKWGATKYLLMGWSSRNPFNPNESDQISPTERKMLREESSFTNLPMVILLMVQKSSNHQVVGCKKTCKSWGKLPINWCRISSINSSSYTHVQWHHVISYPSTIVTSELAWVCKSCRSCWDPRQQMYGYRIGLTQHETFVGTFYRSTTLSSDHPIILPPYHAIIPSCYHRIIRSSHHSTTLSSDHPIILPPYHPIIPSFYHPIIRSAPHSTTLSSDHPIILSSYFCNILSFYLAIPSNYNYIMIIHQPRMRSCWITNPWCPSGKELFGIVSMN